MWEEGLMRGASVISTPAIITSCPAARLARASPPMLDGMCMSFGCRCGKNTGRSAWCVTVVFGTAQCSPSLLQICMEGSEEAWHLLQQQKPPHPPPTHLDAPESCPARPLAWQAVRPRSFHSSVILSLTATRLFASSPTTLLHHYNSSPHIAPRCGRGQRLFFSSTSCFPVVSAY